VQALLASVATGEGASVRPVRARALIAGAIAGFALLAVTGALALPSLAPSGRASATPSPAPQKTLVSVAERTLAAASAKGAGSAQVSALDQSATDAGIRRFTGRVGPDLSVSLAAAGVPERQGREYVALLGKAIQLSQGLSVDDRFDLVVQRAPDGSYGQLLYAGMDRIARADVELMKWTDGKHVIWVNADGVGGDGSQAMKMPVSGRVSSGFGERFHPILGYERFHAGLDLAAAAGTPIVAAADGKVVSAGWAGGYGRMVMIAHAAGIETKYGHMSRIAAYAGEVVHRGEVIGYVGSSGLSTGPHLHFEVTRNGRPVNPQSVKAIAGGPGQLEGAKLVQFQDQLRQILLVGGGA
jgi:murein DD-endopeptidase MepM/ murein hydrolase activator NlpD